MISTPVYTFLRFIILSFILSSTCIQLVTCRKDKGCDKDRDKLRERIRRLQLCGIQPESTLPTLPPEPQCYYKCKNKGLRPRSLTRFGDEVTPVLLTYPKDPNYVEDKRFCLVFVGFYWEHQQDVYYDVKIGTYSCRLKIWENNAPVKDIQVEKGTTKTEYYARFSLHMVNKINRMEMSTTEPRLQTQPVVVSTFSDKNQKGQFPGEVISQMETCVDVLEIEGTIKSPLNIDVATDRCMPQEFRLSYPTQCTSLPFTGGWKRGQTVTSAVWSIALVDQPDQSACVDVDHAVLYSAANEFTDRYINVASQQLRPGLNRICNTFQFTATFGPEDNTKDYGPYDLKICGYIKVEDTPCLIMKPKQTGQPIRLPVDQELELNAEETIEERHDISDYQFDWSCVEIAASVNETCDINAEDNAVFVFKPSSEFDKKEINLTLTMTYKPGTPQATVASESRHIFVVDVNALQVTIWCVSNCKRARVSIVSVVLRADCANCPDLDDLEYSWSLKEVLENQQNPKVIQGDELLTVVAYGNVTDRVFSTTDAGNVLLERVFEICVKMTKRSQGYEGEACEELNFMDSPKLLPGDRCIITPYNSQPGFLDWTYNGLCFWHNHEEYLYKVFTYDVGLNESERTYDLVAFSDISRLPDLELPFGNPKHDYELGVIFHISNKDGQTYVYNMNEAFRERDIIFRVRQPSDHSYLDKVLTITDHLVDRDKSGQFGSRQGIMNVAALVTSVAFNDTQQIGPNLGQVKRIKIRENLISTLAPLASSDVNTVKQLTPILDTLTKVKGEITNVLEDKGAETMLTLTEGLRAIASTDLSTANKLAEQQHIIVERFTVRSVVRQKSKNKTDLSEEETKKFVERASNYSKMYLNIAAGLSATSPLPDTPRVAVSNNSAIAVQWTEVKNDTVFNVSKGRSEQSPFGSSVTLEADSLNISEGSVVDVVMAVTDSNLFVMGGGAADVNMPMINFELQDRNTHETFAVPSLSKPADVFIERTATADVVDEWQWERINITEPVISGGANLSQAGRGAKIPPDPGADTSYRLLNDKSVSLNASDTHAILLSFQLPSRGQIIDLVTASFIGEDGTQRLLFQTSYPNVKNSAKRIGHIRKDPDVIFLPRVEADEVGGRYEVKISIRSVEEWIIFMKDSAPYINMLKAMVACQTWNATSSAWETSGCEVTDFSNFEVLHCRCRHLSVFSGGILVTPRPIDIFNAELFLEFFNNPAVVSVVVFIWLSYFILIYWAREEDWLDSYKSRVAVLEDNHVTDTSGYLVCCVTGWWINSGTTAKVFMYLKGTKGMSRVHRLTDDEQDLFVKGAENWFILTTPKSLGKIKSVVIWHDSTGFSPAWFVKEVYVEDLNRGQRWHCLYNDWISVEHGDGDLCVEIPAMSPEEIHERRLYQVVLKTSLVLRSSHVWLSIGWKPCYSSFTRVQRVTCALCVLLTTMLGNVMFFGVPTADGKSQANKGPLRLNFRSIIIGIECALVVFPINMLLVELFSQTSRRPRNSQYPSYGLEDERYLEQDISDVESSSLMTIDEKSEFYGINADLTRASAESVAFFLEDDSITRDPDTISSSSTGISEGGSKDINASAITKDEDGSTGGRVLHTCAGFSTNCNTVEHQRGEEDCHHPNTDPAICFAIDEIKGTADPFDDVSYAGESRRGGQNSNDSASQSDVSKNGNNSASQSGVSQNSSNQSGVSKNGNNSVSQSDVSQSGNNSASQSDVSQSGNNSASQSGIEQTNQCATKTNDIRKSLRGLGSCRLRSQPYQSGQLTEQLHFITETTWFQNALTFLRKNTVKIEEGSQRKSLDFAKHVSSGPGGEKGKASSESTYPRRSYFDKLKMRQQEQGIRRGEHKETRARREAEEVWGTNSKPKVVVDIKAMADFNMDAGTKATKAGNEARPGTNKTLTSAEKRAMTRSRQKRKQQDHNTESAPETTERNARTTSLVQSSSNVGSRGDGRSQSGSYFDKLKEKKGRQLQNEAEKNIIDPSPQLDTGDWIRSEEKASVNSCRQPATGMKPTGYCGERPQMTASSIEKNETCPDAGPKPQPCWFCSKVPGRDHTIRPLAGKPQPDPRCVLKNKSRNWSKSFKTKLKNLARKSPTKGEKEEKPVVDDDDDPAGNVPFDTILRYHDYEYEEFQKKGSKALKSFRRRAAQCIAEEYLNSNANARSSPEDKKSHPQHEDDSEYELVEVKERDSHRKGCASCMKATTSSFMATVLCVFCCQCPRRTPWWTVYVAWTLAMLVAVFSSWVVMLYGLRLGYQGSVDWLSCFFTGFCQNVFVLQPFKVIFISAFYIFILKQHVSVREEAGVKVHDENNVLLYEKMLKEYEARRRLLGGMWTAMDYEYPIPRSKAKDIKLRLEQDAKARMILRETMIWILFLILVAIACQGHTTVEDAYNTNKVIRNMLEKGAYGDLALKNIAETADIWDYIADTVLPTLNAHTDKSTASGATFLLGSVRIRQVRQEPSNDWCKPVVSNKYEELLEKSYCLPSFSIPFQDTSSFNLSWEKPLASAEVNKSDRIAIAWLYRSSSELKEPVTWGQTAVYPGGGYAVSLPGTPKEASDTVIALRGMNWIDTFTRAVIIEMNLYTPSKDLISSASVLCEKEPEGEILSRMFQHTVKLHMYTDNHEKIIAYGETGWLIMLSINMYYEMQGIVAVGVGAYLKSGWTYLELLNFFLSIAATGVHLARIIIVDEFLDQLAAVHFNSYVSFSVPRALDQTLDVLKSLIFLMVLLKLFRVLRFSTQFRVLLQTFVIARESLINETFISFVIFMAFSSICYVLFVNSLEGYRSWSSTMATLFDFGLGNGDFFGYQEAHPVLGPIIYFSFFLSFSTITLSFFVTFVLESFNVARAFVQLNAEEQHVLRYVKRIFLLLIGATPTIKQVRRERRTHPFKPASFSTDKPPLPPV